MHVGNFLWLHESREVRIIDVAMATKFGWNSMSQSEWMQNIGRDYRFFAYTFGLAVMCPEEWLTPPPNPDGSEEPPHPNPRAHECIDFNEIIPLMRQFDTEFNLVINFMIRGHNNLALLPDRFRRLAERFAPRREIGGTELMQAIANRQMGYVDNESIHVVATSLRRISTPFFFFVFGSSTVMLVMMTCMQAARQSSLGKGTFSSGKNSFLQDEVE